MLTHAPFQESSAETELAFDQTLLDGAEPAVFRTYRFTPSSITVGRFQDAAAFADFGVPIARRRTGGGAIWHHDECTFAVAGDASILGSSTDAIFELVHGALVDALAELGVQSRMIGHEGPAPHPRAAGIDWCFAKACRYDLVAPDGRKLVGGAQRRVRRPKDRVLIHGSIPFSRAPGQDFSAAIEDQCDPARIREELPEAFASQLRTRIGPTNPESC